MSLALNPDVELRQASSTTACRRRFDGPTVVLGVVIFAFTVLLLANFVPAISEPDDNGYFAQGSLLFTTGHTSFRAASDAQYIGMHWLLSPSGEYISRYPPGLAVLIGLVYVVFGFRAAVMVNPALAVATLVGTFSLARRLGLTRWWAIVPVAVLAANPTVIHHALSGDSHTSVACVLVWGLTLLLRWSQEGRARDLFFAGALLGLIPTIRYPDAIMGLGLAWFIFSHRPTNESQGVPAPNARTEDGPALNPFWNNLLVGAAGVAIPVVPLLIRNQLLLGGFWKTGYALTNEQTGFGLNYFAQHALQYIQQIQSGGLGLFLALGLIGITLMICGRGTRAVGILFASLALPMLLLYMAYYWAPQMSGAMMRFLLPTFPLYVLAGVWAMREMTKFAPKAARIAVPAVVCVVQILWSIPDASQQIVRLNSAKRPLAMITDAIERNAKEGDVVVASGVLAQHLDYVRKWRLADASLFTGRGEMDGRPGGGMRGGPPGMGGGPDGGPDEGENRPSPMQAEKRDLQRQLYPGSARQKAAKFANDLEMWADGTAIYFVGTEDEVKRTMSQLGGTSSKIIESFSVPGGMGGPGTGGPMGGGPMGGPMGGRFGGGGPRGRPDPTPVTWVIARWKPG